MHIKVDQNKTKVDLNSLAICKEIAKIDSDKLLQREVSFAFAIELDLLKTTTDQREPIIFSSTV